MPKFILIGLCEPQSADSQAAFDEWFVDQHIEDTAKCPNFVRGSVYKLAGPHLTLETVSQYLSLYEVEADSYEEAERVLNAWQADADAWPGRRRHLATMQKHGGEIPMAINGSGWYELLKSFDGPARHSRTRMGNSASTPPCDVIVIGGPSGVGKSSVGYPLSRSSGMPLLEIDDLFIAIEAVTTAEQQPVLHYWRTHPEAAHASVGEILDQQLGVSRAMAPALIKVIDNHLETRMPVIIEGDFVLPETLTVFDARVRSVFLVEEDEEQIVKNYLAREPEKGVQRKRARVSLAFGHWLQSSAASFDATVLSARPWHSLQDRIQEALAI